MANFAIALQLVLESSAYRRCLEQLNHSRAAFWKADGEHLKRNSHQDIARCSGTLRANAKVSALGMSKGALSISIRRGRQHHRRMLEHWQAKGAP